MKLKTILNAEAIVVMIVGLVMVFPLSFAIIYRESREINAFLLAMGVTLVIGLIVYALTQGEARITLRDSFLIGALGWLLIPLFGCLPYIFAGVLPNWADAYFEAVSGFTTTGATVIADVEIVPRSILLWRSFTQWLGGIGILLVFVALMPRTGISGSQLLKAEIPGPLAGKVVPRVTQYAKAILAVYAALTLIGIIALFLAGLDYFEAINHALTSIATGGFSTRNIGFGAFQNPLAECMVILLMLLGGGNIALYYVACIKKDPLMVIRDEEYQAYLIILLTASAIVGLNLFINYSGSIVEPLRHAVFQVVSLTTGTGHVTYNYDLWPSAGRMLLFTLMFFGGCQCSTTGGIKVVRLLIAIKYIGREIRKYLHPASVSSIRINKHPVAERIILNVMGFFMLYFIFFFVSALFLAAFGYDLVSSITASAALLGNVGPAMGVFGPLYNYAELPNMLKSWFSLVMIIGRLEIYPMLALFVALARK